jgi:ornithine carbamoyltransferase
VPQVPEHLKGRDFTRIATWSGADLKTVLDLADELKAMQNRREEHRLLPGRALGMIFQKPSTRTRVSFEVGIGQLGGFGLYLRADDLQLGRGETIKDTATVLSRYLEAIVIRTFSQDDVEELAKYAEVPVINGLTDAAHPCQALADLMTIRERLGRLSGVRLSYLGDGNNVCASLMASAEKFGMRFVAAIPEGYEPPEDVVKTARRGAVQSGGTVELVRDPREAARGADVLYTDVWTSMGQDEERERRLRAARAGRPRCHRAPLPARTLRRGDHGGDPLRLTVGRLGSGREPAALAEGPSRFDRAVGVLPLKDNVPTRKFPIVTVALIVANFAVWIFYEVPHLQHSVNELAFQPCEVNASCHQIGQSWELTAVTSMFMHASWAHILGNMLFLWIFGNNVEDAMGRILFLVFYVLSGFAATALQTLVTLSTAPHQDTMIPFLGASGAISGVLGAYFILLPRARVLTLAFFFIPILIPAWVFLVIWIGFQLIESSASLQHPQAGGGVAFFAHIGGFAFGLATVKVFTRRPPLQPSW